MKRMLWMPNDLRTEFLAGARKQGFILKQRFIDATATAIAISQTGIGNAENESLNSLFLQTTHRLPARRGCRARGS
jgi:hypothetical protein